MCEEIMYPFERLGNIWFPLRRGIVREGFSKLALSVETPPPKAPPLRKGRTLQHNFKQVFYLLAIPIARRRYEKCRNRLIKSTRM